MEKTGAALRECLPGRPGDRPGNSSHISWLGKRWRLGVCPSKLDGEAMPGRAYRWQQMPIAACGVSWIPGGRYPAQRQGVN